MFINLFRKIGSSPKLLIGVLLLEIISVAFMMHKLNHVVMAFGAGAPPDFRFGYKPRDFYVWLEKIGPYGRKQYLDMVMWDLFPYMECYTLLIGSLLLKECEVANRKIDMVMVMPFAMAFDVVETLLNGYVTLQFPHKVDDYMIVASSVANQLKWISLGSGALSLSLLFMHNHICHIYTVQGKKSD
mmetsp:Transcript_8714/g.10990  ORF Transcript_8714/g.10990 Transcript_8714/m.10990 type:complete len:186 (+) Transcript_8714:74-631(+)